MKKSILILSILTVSTLLLSGCFRKHIESAPPAKQPARQATTAPTTAPTPAPVKVDEQSGIIEETYIVDAPAEAAVQPADIDEGNLAEEPLPQTKSAQDKPGTVESQTAEKQVVAEEITITEEVVVTEELTSSTQAEAGMYYIQIGAFSDLENANKALARVLSDGYKDSVLSKTDTGLYRVQAGSFPDEASAGNALATLKADYPEGFVFKKSTDNQ
ncbi:SPOR domain-containing protein [uncultured Pseudodesulfovibrio sp.]|uniref:SPOR domain-containing protein n=1 Tax=uncultured Pseudodesulfovibrio sp. TaxID=2035858 RepID=UPI0029C6F27B|nr:SPOR domain-containing protein [uncultured Pseudodesulfovibrio sp.]